MTALNNQGTALNLVPTNADLDRIGEQIDKYNAIRTDPRASAQAIEFADRQLVALQYQWASQMRAAARAERLRTLERDINKTLSSRRTPPPAPRSQQAPADLPRWAAVLLLVALLSLYAWASTEDYNAKQTASFSTGFDGGLR